MVTPHAHAPCAWVVCLVAAAAAVTGTKSVIADVRVARNSLGSGTFNAEFMLQSSHSCFREAALVEERGARGAAARCSQVGVGYCQANETNKTIRLKFNTENISAPPALDFLLVNQVRTPPPPPCPRCTSHTHSVVLPLQWHG
jgi:hypothetical protein